MERHETGSKTPKEKEIKYFVLKLDDIHNKLTSEEENTLYKLADKIGRARVIEGKPYSNRYIVVNEEEPYAKKVWDMILGCDLPCFRKLANGERADILLDEEGRKELIEQLGGGD